MFRAQNWLATTSIAALLSFLVIDSTNATTVINVNVGYGQGSAELEGSYASSFIPMQASLEYVFVETGISIGLNALYGLSYYRVGGTTKEGQLTTYGLQLGLVGSKLRFVAEYLFSTELYATSDRTISVNDEPFRRSVFSTFTGTSGAGAFLAWDMYSSANGFSKTQQLRTSWILGVSAPSFVKRRDNIVVSRPTHEQQRSFLSEEGTYSMLQYYLGISFGIPM